MNKQFVVTGIHGHLDTFRKVIEMWDPKEEDLVFMGDLINYGHNSYNVLQEVMDLKYKYANKVHLLMGKHECLLEDFLKNPSIKAEEFFRHGGITTVTSFASDGIPIEAFQDTYYMTEEVLPRIDFGLFEQYVFYSQATFESHYLAFISNVSKDLESFLTTRKQLDYPKPFVVYSESDSAQLLQSNYLVEYLNKSFYDKKKQKTPIIYNLDTNSDSSKVFMATTTKSKPKAETLRFTKNKLILKQEIALEE